MTQTIETTCKFCRKPIFMECDGIDQIDAKVFNLEIWKKNVACNRCANYRVGLRQATERMFKVCESLLIWRTAKLDEKRKAAEDQCHEMLQAITKKIATVVCDYFRVANQWEPGFADDIFNHPNNAGKVVSVYLRGIRSISES